MSSRLFDVIRILEDGNIHFFLARDGAYAVTIFATVVGKRIEIYVDQDDQVDFSVFRGSEDVSMGLNALTAELDAD